MSAPVVSISVVICTWNRAEVLDATLRTLAAQRGVQGVHIECIVDTKG